MSNLPTLLLGSHAGNFSLPPKIAFKHRTETASLIESPAGNPGQASPSIPKIIPPSQERPVGHKDIISKRIPRT